MPNSVAIIVWRIYQKVPGTFWELRLRWRALQQVRIYEPSYRKRFHGRDSSTRR